MREVPLEGQYDDAFAYLPNGAYAAGAGVDNHHESDDDADEDSASNWSTASSGSSNAEVSTANYQDSSIKLSLVYSLSHHV